MNKRAIYLWLTALFGVMLALTLGFSILGRINKPTWLLIFGNILIGGLFFYFGNELSRLSRRKNK